MDLWTALWSLLPPLEIAWIAIATVYIVLQRRSAQATMAWVLTLALFPAVGIVFYLLMGPRRFEKRKRRRLRARGAVDQGTRTDESLSYVDPQGRHLAALIEGTVGRAGRLRNGELEIFVDGESKYRALVEAVSAAQRHVHMEYYIWEPDTIGTRIRDLLVERAKAGVEVRVLVDGFGSSGAHDKFWAPLRDAGGQVRRFNALSLARWRPRMANFRSHRKLAIIDGRVGFTGGMNLSDVHSAEFSGDKAWRDTHLELRGPIVKGLQMVFFEDWHYAGGDAPRVDDYLPAPEDSGSGPLFMQVVSSGPDENLDAIHKMFFAAITGAIRRVQVTTPYFVPDETIVNALQAAALRGAEVCILVPSAGDQPLVAAAARSYYPELLETGIRIFEYGEPVLHSKTLVVDDVAVVGTANVDNRSFRLNFEVAVAVHDVATAQRLAQAFADDLKSAQEVTLAAARNQPWPHRLLSATARLFSPLL